MGTGERVYVGLGSNLESPRKQLASAVQSLRALPKTDYLADSGLFSSRAMLAPGMASQPEFCNAVAELETALAPMELLRALQDIEQAHGRQRGERWAARTLDLDILLFGDWRLDEPELVVPHPGIGERDFVLIPLQRLNPALVIPGHGKLGDMLSSCPDNGVEYAGEIV